MNAITSGLRTAVAELTPGYFAMVMATGIVSTASWLMGIKPAAVILFRLNIALYAILWLLLLGRIIFYPRRFLADLGDHRRGAGYFTTVAGTCILGTQFVILDHALTPAILLLSLGAVLWIVLIYGVFALFTVRVDKPPFENGINGSWLIAVVGTQSVSILSGLLVFELSFPHNGLVFFSLCMFLLGCMLYILIITLIFYRFMFFQFRPADLSHSYWINMGAVAITTLAGTVLIGNAPAYSFLNTLLPFISGFTIFYWATATWWIPLLLVLGVWRFIIHREQIFYDPQYWSVVFPLGMYTTCTLNLAGAMKLDFLSLISRCFLFAALVGWTLVFLALLHSLAVSLRRPSTPV
ncbi:Predicted C4-dicarboxylate transporter/malic acid transport protein [Syntrophobacter sp. SbD2]|nr:Predicted C4-dicarboxylate transporter/malic acid transport protein [Syntrophobacter sp. SbD2]